MKKLALLSCVVLGSMVLTGCQNYRYAGGEGETVGTVLGGVGGGLIGSAIGSGSGQVVATAAGAILGAIAGNHYGRGFDQMDGTSHASHQPSCSHMHQSHCNGGGSTRMNHLDRIEANRAFMRATCNEIGHPAYWENPPTGNQGSVTAISDGMQEGIYCRKFQTTTYIDGRTERLIGTACRTRDGRWVPVY